MGTVRCPKCGEMVEAAEGASTVTCPKCSASVDAAQESAGQKAQEMGRHAYDSTKKAVGNAAEALKILFGDPMGGQKRALDALGEKKALQAGIVFAAVFVLASYLFARAMVIAPLNAMGGFAAQMGHDAYEAWAAQAGRGGGEGVGIGMHIKWILISFVPAVGLSAGFLGIGKIFHGRVNIASSVFTGGVALLPTAVALFAGWLFGIGNMELVMLVTFFGGCISVLLVNASLVDVQGLSTRKAVLLTPTVILVAGYITKVIAAAVTTR